MGSLLLQQIPLALGIIMSRWRLSPLWPYSFPNERVSTALRT